MRCALEQGRDVMAVPGSVLSGRNRGSHGLLKDGAKVVESADDILEGAGLAAGSGMPVGGSGAPRRATRCWPPWSPGQFYRLNELWR